jgi:hypothetical protein
MMPVEFGGGGIKTKDLSVPYGPSKEEYNRSKG